MTVQPITYADLAELHEVLGTAGAAHFRTCADEERPEPGEVAALQARLDAIGSDLDEVPDPPKSAKHNDTCWKRHARCLATRLADEVAA